MRTYGWWEEYRCGCVSEMVRMKRDLTGYCGQHGDDARRQWYTPKDGPTSQETKPDAG